MKIEVLMSHIRKGNVKALERDLTIFVKIPERSINDTDMFDKTLLMEAALLGNVEIMTLLLKQGAKVDIYDTRSKTPLMCAALSGNIKAVELLLEQGAAIEMHNEDGETALSCAAINSDIAMMGYLLAKKADIHVQDVSGKTLLKEAYSENNMDMVDFLVQQGIDVNAEMDSDGDDENRKTLLVEFLSTINFIKSLSLIEYNANFEPAFKLFVNTPVLECIVLDLARQAERMIPQHAAHNDNMKTRAQAAGVAVKTHTTLIGNLHNLVRDYLYRDAELLSDFDIGLLSTPVVPPVRMSISAPKKKRDEEGAEVGQSSHSKKNRIA